MRTLCSRGCSNNELIAEGVETAAELATLRELGVPKAQGYLLGRPASYELARTLTLVHCVGSRG
jgi:EAL domain-containing protein (putative c-di-GMP-specific phosphodiesterase class I)